jgi:SAM-dependent methyltransferase
VNIPQRTIDTRNAAFWDEACGTEFANIVGATGSDAASIAAFDAAFFRNYPYLERYVGFDDLRSRDVLEVGLGYGSVSQRLAEAGACFTGLDIAAGPVAGVNHRLRQIGASGQARQGSILEAPFEDASFDVIVAIGCYHHTGNIERALDETRRLLRPGGRGTVMVYNATSYLRWIRDPRRTWSYVQRVRAGDSSPLIMETEQDRGDFDRDKSGHAAPETALLSKTHFKRLLSRRFKDVRVDRVNAVAPAPFGFIPRSAMLRFVGPILGLDLYARFRR